MTPLPSPPFLLISGHNKKLYPHGKPKLQLLLMLFVSNPKSCTGSIISTTGNDPKGLNLSNLFSSLPTLELPPSDDQYETT
jgi:hypothetical protein